MFEVISRLRRTLVSFLILLSIGGGRAQLIDLTDPISMSFSRYYGSTGDGRAGVPVCGGFDCDGDLINDIAFAQIQADPVVIPETSPRTGAGEITLIFGDGTIGARRDTEGFQTDILKIAGDQSYEVAGAEIWMQEVNGDAFGDLLIGRQNYSKGGRTGAGALTIIFGGPTLRTWAESEAYLDLANLPSDLGNGVVTFVGAAAGDRLGIWMRADDITGDGIADIVVGADQISTVDQHGGGVYVIQGGPYLAGLGTEIDLLDFGQGTFPVDLQTRVALIRPPSPAFEDHFGATVNVADLDGNGRAEVIAAVTLNRAGAQIGPNGNPSDWMEGPAHGRMFIAWDENFPPGPWPNGYAFVADTPLLGDYTRIDGSSDNVRFGEELLGGEDYSGDGFPDLFVGDLAGSSPGIQGSGLGFVFYNAAKLRGLSFNAGSPPADIKITKVYGPSAGSLGTDTMAHGDFDDDGIADLVCGNPHDSPQMRAGAGSVHVFYGQPGGWPTTIDLVSGNLPTASEMRIVQIDGGLAGDTLCYSASVGFINGDNHIDLIMNEMTGNGFGGTPVDVGNLLVVSGAAMGSAPLSEYSFPNGNLLDFGVVQIGQTVTRTTTLNRSSGMMPSFTSSLAGPEMADYALGLSMVTGDTLQMHISFTPTVKGPHGAAVEFTLDEAVPTRLGLRGIGLDPTCIEADFRRFGESNLFRFNSDYGDAYELLKKGDLGTGSSWQPMGTLQSGTGGWIYVNDDLLLPSSLRAFYKVQRD